MCIFMDSHGTSRTTIPFAGRSLLHALHWNSSKWWAGEDIETKWQGKRTGSNRLVSQLGIDSTAVISRTGFLWIGFGVYSHW